ncbi:glycoside hydrolase family 3 protein [Lacticaseibacillus mingshuiensis]|uniref:glycoside hydrolase family 3 protein n=1 Tax=Lacticaseibacillus mingshuiensis TaxID=2799574 RepID=UPI0019445B00|nr:glycoside hydrolase family 3 N-terminal domain-containing protein [Lacticaseibacillus mingshuiensis]
MNGWKMGTAALAAAVMLGTGATQPVQAVSLPKVDTATLDRYIDRMSLDEKIGQLFISRTPASVAQAQNDVAQYHLGGLILFGTDFSGQTVSSMQAKLAGFQAASKLPLLIATDQEGGTVSRLSDSAAISAGRSFPSPQQSNAAGGTAAVVKAAEASAQLLKTLGVNWNFAPVADVSSDPNSFIYARTMGMSYADTANVISQVVPAIQNQGVAASLKHFPGYGSAIDTHTQFATVDRPLATLKAEDLVPFQAGINAGVDSVMVTHIVMSAIDPDYPASLSAKVVKLLRGDLHFDGVIITDDLAMGAIKQFATAHHLSTPDVLAVQAGNDGVMADDYATGIPAIKAAVANGSITMTQLDSAVRHILQLKVKLGLVTAAMVETPRVTVTKTTTSGKTATITGRVIASKVSGGSQIAATEGEKTLATSTVGNDGTFSLRVLLTSNVQRAVLTVKQAGVATATVVLAAAPKDASSKATSSSAKATDDKTTSSSDKAVQAKTKPDQTARGLHSWLTLAAGVLLVAIVAVGGVVYLRRRK